MWRATGPVWRSRVPALPAASRKVNLWVLSSQSVLTWPGDWRQRGRAGEIRPGRGMRRISAHSVREGSVAELIKQTRSVFANDKLVKLMQDVTRERKIFEK